MAARFRYAPLAKIASGGTATVYIGARGAGGELVALKRPHVHVLEDPRQRREVLREANLAAGFRHPNIVGVHEVEADGDELQLVMDYVEGTTLGSLIVLEARREARVPPRVALRILLDACQGLAAVHREANEQGELLGLVHRDVSPQNILVGVDGRARLTDFGLARAVYAGAPSTTQGTLKGKLGYMAPEYVHRGQVDRGVDVFAMGVVLWETLAGRRLFRGDNEAQTLDKVLKEEPGPLAAIAPELAALDPLILRAVAKDPEARFPSAVELLSSLEAAASAAGLVGTQQEVALYLEHAVGEELLERRARVHAALRARRRPYLVAAFGFTLLGTVLTVMAVRENARAPSPAAASKPIAAPPSVPTSPPSTEPWTPSSTALPASASAPPPASSPQPRPPRSPALPPNPYERPPRH